MNTWFRVQAVPLDDGLVVTFADVTLEKTSKHLLELSETRLTAIFDTVGVGIVVVDEWSASPWSTELQSACSVGRPRN